MSPYPNFDRTLFAAAARECGISQQKLRRAWCNRNQTKQTQCSRNGQERRGQGH